MEKTPKIDRKELKRPDQFVAKGQAAFAFLLEKRRRFLPVLIGGALLIGGVYLFDYWTEQKLEKSWSEYNRILKLTGQERLDGFKVFHTDHGSSRPGYFAAVFIADSYYDDAKKEAVKKDGKPQEAATQAVSWYGRALEFSGLLSDEKQLLYVDRGGAKEILGQLDDAMKDYQMGADFGGEPAGLALLNIGRLHEMKGDKSKAEEIYKKIGADFGNTEYARLAKGLLRRMTSPLWQETKS
jgi:tetratricopeptide (TPR) repeat protein